MQDSLAATVCIDVEASALEDGYPIEIGIAEVPSGAVRAWLIRPMAGWIERGVWSAEAEAVHGISLAQLSAEGLPPQRVAEELVQAVQGARLVSDNPSYDGAWLEMLYRAAGIVSSRVQLEDFHAFAWNLAARTRARPDIAIMKAEAEAWRSFPGVHRAGPDARRNAEVLRDLAGLRRDERNEP